jgi:hypothetical protein
VGVSGTLAIRALAQHAGLPPATVAHRLMGSWQPSAAAFAALVALGGGDSDLSRPFPSSSPPSWRKPPSRWASAGPGSPSGNGMASAPRSSGAAAAPSSGPAARS